MNVTDTKSVTFLIFMRPCEFFIPQAPKHGFRVWALFLLLSPIAPLSPSGQNNRFLVYRFLGFFYIKRE